MQQAGLLQQSNHQTWRLDAFSFQCPVQGRGRFTRCFETIIACLQLGHNHRLPLGRVDALFQIARQSPDSLHILMCRGRCFLPAIHGIPHPRCCFPHLRSRLLDGLLTGTVELHAADARRRDSTQPGHIFGEADLVPQIPHAVSALTRFLEEVQEHRIGAHLLLFTLAFRHRTHGGTTNRRTSHRPAHQGTGLVALAALPGDVAGVMLAVVADETQIPTLGLALRGIVAFLHAFRPLTPLAGILWQRVAVHMDAISPGETVLIHHAMAVRLGLFDHAPTSGTHTVMPLWDTQEVIHLQRRTGQLRSLERFFLQAPPHRLTTDVHHAGRRRQPFMGVKHFARQLLSFLQRPPAPNQTR